MTARVSDLAALPLAAAAMPSFASGQTLHVLITTFLSATLALGWNIVGGMAGQMLLGLSLFVGLGAYTSTILQAWYGISPWFGLLAGMLLAAALGSLIGLVIFRRRLVGVYFALATLAISEMALYLALNWEAVGGANGLIIPPALGLAAFQFAGKTAYYEIALGGMALTALLCVAISRGRLGYRLAAIRENEQTAAALGIDVVRWKVAATAVSASIAASVGTFYAQYVLFVDPDSVFGIRFTVDAIVYTYLGGVGTPLGPMVGAIIFVPVLDGLLGALGGRIAGLHLVLYGIIVILVMRFAPGGLVPLVRLGWLTRRSAKVTAVP